MFDRIVNLTSDEKYAMAAEVRDTVKAWRAERVKKRLFQDDYFPCVWAVKDNFSEFSEGGKPAIAEFVVVGRRIPEFHGFREEYDRGGRNG